jgi:Mg/Co/Ni transporter MgtE
VLYQGNIIPITFTIFRIEPDMVSSVFVKLITRAI